MKIIVVGCGKVGQSITQQLSAENHDITVIDINHRVVEDITTSLDVMGVVGNGVSYSVQMEAGIADTQLLIAVTDSDEENLLTCLIAKKASGCNTIARVRNPVYTEEISFIKDELGLSMTINPELAAAGTIANLLRFPSAIEVDTFARGRIDLLKFVIPPGSILHGCVLKNIRSVVRSDVLVCAVERGPEVVIPDGNFTLKSGDMVGIVASPVNARDFFIRAGIGRHRIRSCMIVGGGTIAYYLAKALTGTGIGVKIIEQNRDRCKYLSQEIPKAVVINGDATNEAILREEQIEQSDAFVSLTGIDEANVFLSLFAQQVSGGKVITKVNRLNYGNIVNEMDLGSVIRPKEITAEYIIRFVRAMQSTIGSNVETLYHVFQNKVEALEFIIQEGAPVVGVTLSELKTRKDVLIAGISRKGKTIIPNGQSRIEVGDSVIIVTTGSNFTGIRDILEE